MPATRKRNIDATTEEKILEAARKIFTQKGYSATRTRDIAEEAGLNLALLNYYFRSKEKLFDIIMLETLQQFMSGVRPLLSSESSSMEEKITAFVGNYIDLLIKRPDLPLFILSEIKANPKKLISKLGLKEFLMNSHFLKQFKEAVKTDKIAPVHPLHFIMNIVALTVFPFIGSPILQNLGDLNTGEFNKLMEERKKLIPQWIKAMIKKT
ncbi:MAG: TetR/AcrR family transcriptional regulator [Chitinophagaceae bacterium]